MNTCKPFKQLARENNKIIDKQWNKKLAEKKISPFYFNDRVFQVG